MDTRGYILLIIIAVCLIALICVVKKQKKLTKGTTSGPKVPPEPEIPETSGPEITVTSGPPQHTIYAFQVKNPTRLCPFCDAENRIGEQYCNVCGQKL